MARRVIKDIVFLAAMIFFFMFFLPVWGQEFTLLDSINVTSGQVYFSDIVKEPVPSDMDVVVASAPDAGDVVFLRPKDVLRRLKKNAEIKGRGVYIYRASKLMKSKEVRSVIMSLLPEGWVLYSSVPSVISPVGVDFSLDFPDECSSGRCFAGLYAEKGNARVLLLTFKVVKNQSIMVWKAARDIKRGDVITEIDIEVAPLKGGPVRDCFYESEPPVGLVARTFIPKGYAIKRPAVEKRYIVMRGRIVDVRFSKANIALDMKGRALENGAIGDFIKVENLSSHRIFFAKVVGKGLLEVGL